MEGKTISGPSFPLVLRLADSLFVSPLITTIPEAQRISGVKQYRTARKGIEKLVR